MRSTRFALLTALAVAAVAPGPARAQAGGDTRLREALRQTTAQLRAIEEERAAWKAAEAQLKKELEAARAEADAARRATRGGEAKASAALARQVEEQTAAAAAAKDGLARCEAAAGESTRGSEAERARLEAEVRSLTEKLAAADARSDRIFGVGREIVEWASRDGAGFALCDPFFGFRRAKLERVAQDYADKLIEAKGTGTP